MDVVCLMSLSALVYNYTTSITSYFLDIYCDKYREFNDSGKRIFDSYVGSFYNALFTTTASIYYILYPYTVEDMNTFVTIFAGYFLYDLSTSFNYSLSLVDIVHHLMAILPCFGYLFMENNAYHATFVPWLTLVEMSTVFLDIRWFLFNLDLHEKFPRLNYMVSILFAFSFGVTRIVILPLITIAIYLDENINDGDATISIIISSMVVLCCLQIYWFVKIVKKIKTTPS